MVFIWARWFGLLSRMGVTAAAAVGVLMAMPTAGYADSTCTTTVANQTLGNVLVPAGQTCTLVDDNITGSITNYGILNLTTNNTPVGGNVTLEPGSQTQQNGGATWTINGNLTENAYGATQLNSYTISVGKNMTIENVTDGPLQGWSGFFNVVYGSLVLQSNTGPAEWGANTIYGNVSCSGNNPAPTNGGVPNTVFGKETGQCAGMG